MISIRELKQFPKEEFLKFPGMTEQIYEDLHKAKEGWIKVERENDGRVERGYTYAFGEGISCRMDNLCSLVLQETL